jgi:hypothetical protein
MAETNDTFRRMTEFHPCLDSNASVHKWFTDTLRASGEMRWVVDFWFMGSQRTGEWAAFMRCTHRSQSYNEYYIWRSGWGATGVMRVPSVERLRHEWSETVFEGMNPMGRSVIVDAQGKEQANEQAKRRMGNPP